MILFSLPSHERLGAALLSLGHFEPGRASVGRFPNLELHAAVETAVKGRRCVLLGSIAPPDEDFLATLLIADTLAREGAQSVTALLPYLGYARQDREELGQSRGAAWAGELLRATRIERVVTVDVHSSAIHRLFPIPLHSLSPAPAFAAEVARLGLSDPTIVAPDKGALERAEAVRRASGIERPLAHFAKQRTSAGIVHSTLQGEVGRQAVIVDDILDTGGTLLSACDALRRAGVEEIVIMTTHGLFTGTRWQQLPSLGVRRIYCTDTIPQPERAVAAGVVIVPIVGTIAEYFSAARAEVRA